MLKIMATVRAIHNLAKIYHWKSNSTEFYGDHLLFDRIADTFDEELVDKFAEQYYMNNPVMLEELDHLTETDAVIESEYLTKSTESYNMFMSLRTLLNTLNEYVNNYDTRDIRAFNVLMDDISSNCVAILGLITGRLNTYLDPVATSEYYESAPVKNAIKEGLQGGKVLTTLGVNSEELVNCYNSGKALANDLSAQLGISTALKMLESASRKSLHSKLFKTAARSLSSK